MFPLSRSAFLYVRMSARSFVCGACVCVRARGGGVVCGGGGLCARGQGSALRVAAGLTKPLPAGSRSAVVAGLGLALLRSGGYQSRRKTPGAA